jgi:hypothetical protein
MSGKLSFYSSCTGWPGDVKHLDDLIQGAKEIGRGTFLKHVDPDAMRDLENQLGYAKTSKQGLTMATDYHVAYFKSKLRGCEAVYFVWSAIEFVFTDLACLERAGERMAGRKASPEEPVVGLTRKGAQLDLAMRTVFNEFIVEESPGIFKSSPAAVNAVNNRFDALWKQAGQARSPLKTSVLAMLRDGPQPIGAVMRECFLEEKRLTVAEFRRMIQELFEGNLMTGDPSLIWIQGE